MNIAILGAGAMGSLFGGLLAEAGAQVVLIDVDQAYIDAVQAQGLRLETDQGDRRIRQLTALRPEQATTVPNLLIVFTKSLHSRAALGGVQRLIGPDTHLMTLQNGLGNVEVLQEFAPVERLLVGVTTWPADVAAPGHVHSHGEGAVRFGTVDGVARPFAQEIARLFDQAGLRGKLEPAIWPAIWEKLAFNAALNCLCTIAGCSVDRLSSVPGGEALALAVADEVIAVAQSQGVAADGAKAKANIVHAIATHVGHDPSMLKDLKARRPTEVEAIAGAAAAAGRGAGIDVARTEALLVLVRLTEKLRGAGAVA
ncbi:MAG TPA: 2-dehydropantoate 2-reductase [Caulobacteraceae bacterium]|jgi:2-dehydropantoate 2-reductase|nr:2-dehydropantoate 2-reductase [Caulobacteraceae bacterium]